jgi:hypothetical protein
MVPTTFLLKHLWLQAAATMYLEIARTITIWLSPIRKAFCYICGTIHHYCLQHPALLRTFYSSPHTSSYLFISSHSTHAACFAMRSSHFWLFAVCNML